MPRRFRRPYPPEFKEQIVEIARAGGTVGELCQEFEPSAQTIKLRLTRVVVPTW